MQCVELPHLHGDAVVDLVRLADEPVADNVILEIALKLLNAIVSLSEQHDARGLGVLVREEHPERRNEIDDVGKEPLAALTQDYAGSR